jgi:transmembrane sensor
LIGWMSGMRERRVERHAYKWVMRMLDDPTRYAPSLERWLSKNPEHRSVYKRVAVEVGYASDAAAQNPALRYAVYDRSPNRQPSRRGHLLLPVGLAATAALLAVIGWQVVPSQWRNAADRREVPQVIAVAGGVKATRLADGSVLTLYGSSSAALRYTSQERAIDLARGRARFSVKHDPSRPFVVYVRGGKVTAVGTLFEVEAGTHVIVRLLNGRVIVTKPSPLPATRGKDVILTKGQQLMFAAPAAAHKAPLPPASKEITREMRTFDDVPVSEILRDVNGRSPTKLVLTDPRIGEEKVFADINVDDPQGVARKLALLLNLRIDRSTPGEIRLSRAH